MYTVPGIKQALKGLTLREQVDHLLFVVTELLTPAPGHELHVDWPELSQSQSRLLALLLSQPNCVFTPDQMQAALGLNRRMEMWGDANVCSRQAVMRIRRKIAARGAPLKIHTVIGVGYKITIEDNHGDTAGRGVAPSSVSAGDAQGARLCEVDVAGADARRLSA